MRGEQGNEAETRAGPCAPRVCLGTAPGPGPPPGVSLQLIQHLIELSSGLASAPGFPGQADPELLEELSWT